MNSRQPAFYTFAGERNASDLQLATYVLRFQNGGHKEEATGCVGRCNTLSLYLHVALHDSQHFPLFSVLILLPHLPGMSLGHLPFSTQQT